MSATKKIAARSLTVLMVFQTVFTGGPASVRASAEEGGVDLTSGLAGYYTFDNTLENTVTGGSAVLHGGAGDTWNAAAEGQAAYAEGKNGQAYSFAGDAGGKRGEGLELDVKMPASYTISYWVSPDTVNSATSMVFVPIDTNNGLNIADNWFGTTFPTVRIWGPQAASPDCYMDHWIAEADALCGQWTYITLTCDENGKNALYINGAQAATGSSVPGALAGKDIFLGINFWNPTFDGLIDDVAVYDRALSGDEVLALYSGNGIPEENAEVPDYVLPARVSVHDPSIVKDENTGTYYVFGSHRAWAKSNDLIHWETFTNNLNDKAVYDSIFADEIAWAAMGDSTYALDGNMWAPDVIWNETLNKWCMYMSINGCSWNSCISLLTADSLDGDWTYVGPVIYSGFTSAASSHDFSRTDYAEITGESGLAARYEMPAYTCTGNDGKTSTAPTTWNWRYGAHAIDPCIVVDDAGDWYMSYGSWSGGIYMIKLDKTTGLRDKTEVYPYVERESDPYMGQHLAGGNGVSGEASYIQKFGDYYFLYVTLGGLTAKGGYNMRVFRSENVAGPYVDGSGDDARTQTADFNSPVGNRVMSGYQWSHAQKGFVAQGHNSVMEDSDGRMYLFNHYRFNDGTEGHEMRVHQLFLNEDGWLVTAPFEYTGESLSAGVTAQDAAGDYGVLFHRLNIDFANLEVVEEESLTLAADGTVAGDRSGSWSFSAAKGAPYVDMELDGVSYRGLFVQQQIEGSTEKTWCFTLLGSNEISAWGYRYVGDAEELAKRAAQRLTMPQGTFVSLELPNTGIHASTITWESSNEAVLASDGTVTPPQQDTEVSITATVTVQGTSVTRTFPVTVYSPQSGTENKVLAAYFSDGGVSLTDAVKGTWQYANPFYDGTTKGLMLDGGVSIRFEVEAEDGADQWLRDIISFTDDGGGKLYFEGNSYLGYNAGGAIFDANIKNGTFGDQSWRWGTDFLGKSASVELRLLPTGFEVYVNGTLAYNQDSVEPYEEGKTEYTVPGELGTISYPGVLAYLNDRAEYLNFGWGSWWEGGYAGTIKNVVLSVLPPNNEEFAATVGSLNGNVPEKLDWWNYSNFYGMKGSGDFTMSWEFTNYNPKDANYHNFAVAVTTNLDRTNHLAADWYLRADAYSNSVFGDSGATAAYEFDWKWEDFISLMNRARIDATLTRVGSTLTFKAVISGSDGKTYHYTAKVENAPADDVMVYLGGEDCCLTVHSASVTNSAEPAPTPTDAPQPSPTETPQPTTGPEVTPAPTQAPQPTTEPEVTPAPTQAPQPTTEPEVTPAPTQAPQPTTGSEATPTPTEVPQPTTGPEVTPAPTQAPQPTTEPEVTPAPTQAPQPTTGPEVTPAPTQAPQPTTGPEVTPAPTQAPQPTTGPEVTPAPTQAPQPTKPAAEGPQIKASVRLYLGGDASGTYSDAGYAKVWNKDGYTVKFFSDNEAVVTVGRNKGLVSAVSVGTATITAVFTDEAGNTINRTCRVTVKRNAVDAGISRGTEAKLLALSVGDELQTVAYRTASDESVVWGGRDQITDGMRFSSSDESVFTVGRTKGKVTAVGAGEAVLTVWAVQSEEAVYDEDGEIAEYRATTEPRTYLVRVTAE